MKEIHQLNHEQRELVSNNVPYAKKMARKFYRERYRGDLDLEDFEGAALLGLCDAAGRFDPLMGSNFQTYSHMRIKGAMLDMLRSIGSIPRRRSATGEQPSPDKEEENSFHLPNAYSANELASILSASPLLNIQIYPGDDGEEAQLSYRDHKNPEESILAQDTRKQVQQLLQLLSGKERSVVEQYYFDSLLFTEMREAKCGFTKSWLCRIHQNGLGRLRKSIPSSSPLRFCSHQM